MSLPIPGISIADASSPSLNTITKSVQSVFGSFKGDKIIPHTGAVTNLSLLNGNALAPSLVANIGTAPTSTAIPALNITGLVLLQEAQVLSSENWNVFYDITFDSQGGNAPLDSLGDPNFIPQFYKILLYFVAKPQPDPTPEDFNLYQFSVVFSTDTIPDRNGNKYPLGSIKTVEVFVINEDPKTSRGTTTTVQPGG